MAETVFVNIASHLPTVAEKAPHALAVACQKGQDRTGRMSYTLYTLKQLNEDSDLIAHGLAASGLQRGMRAALMVNPCLDFFALTFALFKVGVVPVLIDPGIGSKNLGQCLKEAEPQTFIGIPKAQAARILLGWCRKTVRTSITVGRRFFWGGMSLAEVRAAGMPGKPYEMADTRADETAAILFTSGSTGISKGAVYTHGIFDAQVQYLRTLYGIEPGERDLATFPLFALFGPALGMASIVPDMDASRPAQADPRKLARAIEDFGATSMFASPALLDRLGRYGEPRGLTFPSLKRIISAGAPARPEALARFSKLLAPDVQVFTPYGATEALPVCNIGSHEILRETVEQTVQGKGACVGLPVPGMQVDIIRITDASIPSWSDDLRLPDGQIGEIVVKGPVVTRAYHNRPEATTLAKIPDPVEGEWYHRMGDVGYRDDSDRIWFCGRKMHRVVTAHETLFTIPCEAIFNVHPKVYRTALVGVEREGVVEPVLCVELEKYVKPEEKNQIRADLLTLGAAKQHTESIRTILFHPALPVDIRHNAKIIREQLVLWAKRRLS